MPATQQINMTFDEHITKVMLAMIGVASDTVWTTSGSLLVIGLNGTATLTMSDGYIIDTVTATGATIDNITDTTFDISDITDPAFVTITSKLGGQNMSTIKAGTYTFIENLTMPTTDITFTLPSGSRKYQLNDNNNYGSKSSPDEVCGYIKVYATAKTQKGQNYFFETGNSSVWNRYATSWYCYNDGDIYTATDNTKLRIVEIAEDMTVDDVAYSWFTANIERTLHDSIEQHIQDAYDAVEAKSGTVPTQKNLQNLKSAIESISSGTDTSDGNIEPTTVLKGYKGYAKGVAVDGAIETYDGSFEDVGITVNVHLLVSAIAGGSLVTTSYLKVNSTTVSATDYDFKIVGNWKAPVITNYAGETLSSPTFAVTLLPATTGAFAYKTELNIAYLTDDTNYQNEHFTGDGGLITNVTEQNNIAKMTIVADKSTNAPQLRYKVSAPD